MTAEMVTRNSTLQPKDKFMDFSWSAEQIALKETVIAFAQQELNHDVRRRDREGIFSPEIWCKCGAFGVQGWFMPREYGGQGHDLLTTTLALEALGYGCRDNGLTFALNAQMWSTQIALLEHGSDAQKGKYLPPLIRGEQIGAYAMTEPDSGSDAYSAKTTAIRTDDGYVLNGHKMLITFGPIADFAIIFASTDLSKGKWGLSVFIVDKGVPGFQQLSVQEKMGLRTVPIGQFIFENCFVPEENRIGAEGAGGSIFNSSQEYERACILASQIGAMEHQLEVVVKYARERQQFGKPIGKFQAVSHRITEMKLRLELARLITYRAAWTKASGKSTMMESALANLYLGDAFIESSMDTIKIHGGRGYLTEYEIERDLRDAMAGPVYGGTSDIQRNIIARFLGL
jgi:alkylation response protein AidB-like acyl-CoA dehydrogenase